MATTAANHGGDTYVVASETDDPSLVTHTRGAAWGTGFGGAIYSGNSESRVEHHVSMWAEVYRCKDGHGHGVNAESEHNLEDLNLVGPRPRSVPTSTSLATPAVLARVRASPKVPELGATVNEAKVMCEREHGTFVSGAAVGCKVGGVTVFACATDDADRLTQCDGYFEGAEVVDVRDSLEEKLGPPTSEAVSGEGFRVFSWTTKGQTVSVTMYAKGVRKTVAAPP